jgi:hypothetical protein
MMVENGTVDEFQWRETKRGVEILAGDAQVLLRGVTVDQVALDHPLFYWPGVGRGCKSVLCG